MLFCPWGVVTGGWVKGSFPFHVLKTNAHWTHLCFPCAICLWNLPGYLCFSRFLMFCHFPILNAHLIFCVCVHMCLWTSVLSFMRDLLIMVWGCLDGMTLYPKCLYWGLCSEIFEWNFIFHLEFWTALQSWVYLGHPISKIIMAWLGLLLEICHGEMEGDRTHHWKLAWLGIRCCLWVSDYDQRSVDFRSAWPWA